MPSLEDYDSGNHLRWWAEYVGAHAHAPFDEEFRAEWLPERSRAELAADARAQAAVARERYDAYRAKQAVEAERLRKIKERNERAAKLRRDAEWAEQRELQRVRAEENAQRQQIALDAEQRRQRWQAEQAEWRKAEEERRVEARRRLRAQAKRHPKLGGGHYVMMLQPGTIKFGDEIIQMQDGEIWNVGEKWYHRFLMNRNAVDV